MEFERFKNEKSLGGEIVTTNDMICKDCKHREDKSSMCKKYSVKPLKVFKDGECDFYERESKVE